MTIYAIAPCDGPHVTAGKKYEVLAARDNSISLTSDCFRFVCDNGTEVFSIVRGSSHIKGMNWTLVEEKMEEKEGKGKLFAVAPCQGAEGIVRGGKYEIFEVQNGAFYTNLPTALNAYCLFYGCAFLGNKDWIIQDENGEVVTGSYERYGFEGPPRVKLRPAPVKLTKTPYVTQKARGVAFMGRNNYDVFNTLDFRVWPNHRGTKYPIFARPCPVRPRHGFVDSRVVQSDSEMLSLVTETLQADREAEVLLMRPLDAKWSAIVNPGGVVFGRGNDGATSGRDSLAVPAPSTRECIFEAIFQRTYEKVREETGIENEPYLELVAEDKPTRPFLVQLRDGPAVKLTSRSIPQTMTVECIDETHDVDLMVWERHINKLAKQSYAENTVIWLPGHTLASHYAVHAVINNLAVVCEDVAPEIGAVLEPDDDAPMGKLNLSARRKLARCLRGLQDLRTIPHFGSTRTAEFSIAAFHASQFWDDAGHLLQLRALALTAIVRYITAACAGEDRHFNTAGPAGRERGSPNYYDDRLRRMIYKGEKYKNPGAKRSLDFERDIMKPAKMRNDPSNHSRKQIYENVFRLTLTECKVVLEKTVDDFEESGWNDGFGGEAWRDGAKEGLKLIEQITRFTASPTPKRYKVLMSAWNNATNAAHNNGKMLNKWIGQSAYNYLDTFPAMGLTNAITAEVVLGFWTVPERRN